MNIDGKIHIAHEYYRSGKLQEAARMYEEILEMQPKNTDALHYFGLICYRLDSFDSAIDYFNEALQLNPNLADTNMTLGNALQKKGRLNEAISYYEKALELNPDLFDANFNLGNVFRIKGQLDEAIMCYQKSLHQLNLDLAGLNDKNDALKDREQFIDYQKYLIDQHRYGSLESEHEKWLIGQKRLLETFFSEMNRDKVILDIACGDGSGLNWFKDNKFTHVIGFDLNEHKFNKAKEIGYQVYLGDMHDLSLFNNSYFDVIYSSHTLEHALDPSKVLNEFERILKNEGLFILVIPFPDTGPDDAHCAKYILKTDSITALQDKEANNLINYLETFGFKLILKRLDSFREPEIWLKLQKFVDF